MAWPGPENRHYKRDEKRRLQKELANLAKAISNYEHVILIVHSTQKSEAERMFKTCGFKTSGKQGVEVKATEIADLEFWMRDVAPTFVLDEGNNVNGIDFNFNGWGGRYPSDNNRRFAEHILRDQSILGDRSIPCVKSCVTCGGDEIRDLVLEGGALETDGEGTLVVTKSSIINPNRNPDLPQQKIEEELCRLLGVTKIIWVPGVPPGLEDYDEVTDAHIDGWVRFVAPGKVVLNYPGQDRHPMTDIYNKTKDVLSTATDAKDRPFEIIDLPEAGIGLKNPDPDRCLSYVNYLLVNGAVIIPRFGYRQADKRAKEIFQGLFPDRKIVPVFLEEIAWSGGGIHCVTQEIPWMKDDGQ
jgi:agmatine deiminase